MEYVKLEFAKGDPILVSKDIIKEPFTSYEFFKRFIQMSKVPWFIEPKDILSIMGLLPEYAASGVGANPILNELVVSFITRDRKNPDTFLRQTNLVPTLKMEGLVRDPNYIKSIIEEKDGTFYCKERCSIEFPSWYMDSNLGEFSEEIHFYGVFIIVCNGKYSVSHIPTMVKSNPIMSTTITREEPVTNFRFIGINDMFYGIDSTIAKIGGSRIADGVVSALVKDPRGDRATDIEKHLKQ